MRSIPTVNKTNKSMKMILKTALGITALSLLLGLQAGPADQPTAAALRPLQGRWEGIQLGREAEGRLAITITSNSLHYQYLNSTSWYKASFTLPAGTNPRQLHATLTGYHPTNGIGRRDIGAKITTIFKIEDGTLTLVAGQSDAPPENFDVEGNRYVLKKVQPRIDVLTIP